MQPNQAQCSHTGVFYCQWVLEWQGVWFLAQNLSRMLILTIQLINHTKGVKCPGISKTGISTSISSIACHKANAKRSRLNSFHFEESAILKYIIQFLHDVAYLHQSHQEYCALHLTTKCTPTEWLKWLNNIVPREYNFRFHLFSVAV